MLFICRYYIIAVKAQYFPSNGKLPYVHMACGS